MSTRGRFIVLEGPDGSGKTTACANLVARMRALAFFAQKPSPCATREPGGTRLAEHFRDVLLQRRFEKNGSIYPVTMTHTAEVMTFLAARADHLGSIRENLEKGHDVICDRWSWSTIAYQAFGGGMSPPQLQGLLNTMDFISDGINPDLVIFFDVNPEVGLARIAARRQSGVDKVDEVDFFQGKDREYFEQVHKGYQYCAHNFAAGAKAICWVDANQGMKEVSTAVLQCAEESTWANPSGKWLLPPHPVVERTLAKGWLGAVKPL